MKLCISKEIFSKFPNLKVGVILAKDIDNRGASPKLKFKIPSPNDPKIKAWENAYKTFGADPKKHKPSIASLVDLAKKGLPKINKLVDIYNYISLKHIVPVGGSDLDKIKGNIYLRISKNKEAFKPLHSKQLEYTKPKEIIYSDDEKVITRKWNYKESDLSKFTEKTKNVILEIEALPPFSETELTIALAELTKLIEKNCGGKAAFFILDKNAPTLDIDLLEPSEQQIEYVDKAKPEVIREKKKPKELNEIELQTAQLIQKVTKLKIQVIGELLETPPDSKLGDLAFPCFTLSKQFKKNPGEIAVYLRNKLIIPKDSIFKRIEVAGPYLNFFVDEGKFAKQIIKEVDENFGKSSKGKGKRVMVEFPSPNTNKPLHLGHLRNMSLGESVSRILEANSYKVIRANLNNDRGIHICKSMLAYKKWGKNKKPNKKPDHFVGDFYILFAQKAKETPELEKETQEMLKKWEAKDKPTLTLWKKMNNWAFDGFNQTYKRFGVKFDKQYYESEIYEKGREMVLAGLGKGIFFEESDGAIVIDLSKYGLDKKILIRSDGTTVYVTQDICLAQIKYNDYRIDKSIYVVGNEQNYHFNVLFKILEMLRALGYKFAKENYHLSHGMVYLPEGRMKSREGTGIDADDLLNQMEDLTVEEIKKRHKKSNKNLASKISLGAIKYFLLKIDAKKDFVFNPKESISLEGNTGPYLQYALVRANKILQKAKSTPDLKHLELLIESQEFELVKKIALFPEIVENAAESYSPHLVANYAYELSQLFSAFYEKCPVIKADKKLKGARLALVEAFAQTLKNALNLLGVEEVEQM